MTKVRAVARSEAQVVRELSAVNGMQLVLWFRQEKAQFPDPKALGGKISPGFAVKLAEIFRQRHENGLKLTWEICQDGPTESDKWLKITCKADNHNFLHWLRKELHQIAGVIDTSQ